jgi:hypothetical protein
MKVKRIVDQTTNRGEFNRAYKQYLEHKKNGIHCSYCKYHLGDNFTEKWYGGYKVENVDKFKIRYPNWKLVSKNRKQWMKKPINISEEKCRWNKDRTYVEIKFST